MHIALDATYLVDPHPSGISVYSRELLDGLAREHPEDSYLHYYRTKQFKRSTRSGFRNVRRRLLLPPLAAGLPWRRPDVFHALNQRVDQRLGQRVVATFHDLFVMTGDYSSADFKARFSAQARRAAKNSDLIIAVSEFTRKQVITLLGVDPQNVRVVPHGVHLRAGTPTLEARENIVLCVGALQTRKNVGRLVEAFEGLPSSLINSWTLVLAGSTAGYGAAEILQRIGRSPQAGRIQLKGYVTPQDLTDLYLRARVFAFPSLDEGFGMPVLEAMAHGVPVITSNRSALPQVAGDAAMLIDPSSVDDLRRALECVLQDSELRLRLRGKGLERAKLFPWGKALAATHEIYRELAR